MLHSLLLSHLPSFVPFSAFSAFSQLVDVTAEFEKLDADESGSIEINEFGPLLRRLSALAHGAPPVGEAERGVLGAAKLEFELFRLLDGPLLRAIPLEQHAYVRRVFSSFTVLGFAPDQIEVVLRAIFHPDAEEADEATRQAWLLLGGTDWASVQNVDPQQAAEVRAGYEQRLRAGQRWREQELLAKATKKKEEAEAVVRAKEHVDSPSKLALTGWGKLRKQRKGGIAAAALASAAVDAAERRRQNPDMLRYGQAPRRVEFAEWSAISLSDFERLVSVFGDYQSDPEMRRCKEVLSQLFGALDAPSAGGHGGRHRNRNHDDDESFSDAEGSFKSSGGPSFNKAGGGGGSFKSRGGGSHGEGGEVDMSEFEELVRRLRPLDKDEREGDAELMALSADVLGSHAEHAVGNPRDRAPAWLTAMATTASVAAGLTSPDLNAASAKTATPSTDAGGGRNGGALAALDMLQKRAASSRLDVLAILERQTKDIIPVEHLSTIRLVLSNLRTAEFEEEESNVLLRALYSFGDAVHGPDYLEEAWDLLRRRRVHLRSAADSLAGEVGEFRTEAHRFRLPGIAAIRNDAARSMGGGARTAGGGASGGSLGGGGGGGVSVVVEDGLREDEFQLIISLLGEHLSEGQLSAIFAVAEFDEGGFIPFEEVGRVLRFMYRRDTSGSGTIAQNEAYARQLEAEFNQEWMSGLSYAEDAGRKVGGAVAKFARDVFVRFSSKQE